MLGSPCNPCCGCSPQDIAYIYNYVRSRSCSVSLTHDLRWQEAATSFVTRSGNLNVFADSDGLPGHSFFASQTFDPYFPAFASGWCNADSTVPQFGTYLGEFSALPVIERRNDGKFYYANTNTEVLATVSGRPGHTCKVGSALYSVDTFIPFTDQWYKWNLRGIAADRSCQRQLRQLTNSVLEVYEQTAKPGTENLALNPSQSSMSSSGAVATFINDAPTYLVTAQILIGATTGQSTLFPGTNCGVRASVQVLAKFRRGSNIAPTLPTSTVQPSYTAQQSRGLLPWINVPGCKAWITAPYYTTNPAFPGGPATDTSQFAKLTPWWDYDLLSQQGIPVAFVAGVPDTGAFYSSQSSTASFSGGLMFDVSSFSGSGFAMRWNNYSGGGAPLWRTGWSFSENMVNPASDVCEWRFPGTSQQASRQYSRTSDVGTISHAAVTLS